jgi:hypothetical protein
VAEGRVSTEGTLMVAVATGGEIARSDKCSTCGEPMLYRVEPRSGRVVASFCGFVQCAAWLREVSHAPLRVGIGGQ